jgi:16S rRNA (cytosine1402-N4)-methyltransferase
MYHHIPVLLSEVLKFLDPKPGDRIIDATLGGGGYTFAIAEKVGQTGKVVALDMDEMALENAKLKIAGGNIGNIALNHANFKDISNVAQEAYGTSPDVAGVVFDLGLSSAQLEDRSRGFSFQEDVPLSMAFGSLISANKTIEIVNHSTIEELAQIIGRYGEERFARPIARAIVAAREISSITTTGALVAAIQKGMPPANRHQSKIHFATRTFQALRIATNDELANLETALASLPRIMKAGGRIVVVSFHSLEDRIVKNFFKKESRGCICPPTFPLCRCGHVAILEILTKKVVTATNTEIEKNPRARSAKLRAATIKK